MFAVNIEAIHNKDYSVVKTFTGVPMNNRDCCFKEYYRIFWCAGDSAEIIHLF